MLPQAQEMLVNTAMPFDVPIGALLALTLFVLLGSGILVESGLLASLRARLGGGPDKMPKLPRRVATAGHRG